MRHLDFRITKQKEQAGSLCIYLHSRQFVAARVEEMEPPATGEAEDRLGDGRASRSDRGERGLQILHLDHGERGFGRLLLVCLESNVHVPGERACVRRSEAGHRHAEHRFEKGLARREVARGQLDEVWSSHDSPSQTNAISQIIGLDESGCQSQISVGSGSNTSSYFGNRISVLVVKLDLRVAGSQGDVLIHIY